MGVLEMTTDLNKQQLTIILTGLKSLENEAQSLDFSMTEEFYELKNKIESSLTGA
jgi:hypothetical protein